MWLMSVCCCPCMKELLNVMEITWLLSFHSSSCSLCQPHPCHTGCSLPPPYNPSFAKIQMVFSRGLSSLILREQIYKYPSHSQEAVFNIELNTQKIYWEEHPSESYRCDLNLHWWRLSSRSRIPGEKRRADEL